MRGVGTTSSRPNQNTISAQMRFIEPASGICLSVPLVRVHYGSEEKPNIALRGARFSLMIFSLRRELNKLGTSEERNKGPNIHNMWTPSEE